MSKYFPKSYRHFRRYINVKVDLSNYATKTGNIDTTNFVKKNKYEKDGGDFEDKINKIDKRIPDDTSLAKKKLILK